MCAISVVGINGWYPVTLPSISWDSSHMDQSDSSFHGNHGLSRVVGGVELSIKFGHQEDLDRVVHAGRGVGWAPKFEIEHRDWESAGRQRIIFYLILYL